MGGASVMRDIVTHCTDTAALLVEAMALFPDNVLCDAAGNPVSLACDKTPTIRNGTDTLALLRVTPEQRDVIASMTTVTILGDVPAYDDYLAAMSTANRAIYDAVYDQTPQTVTLPDNSTYTFTPSPYIGRFM